MPQVAVSWKEQILEWCREPARDYKFRTILLLYGLYIFKKILTNDANFTPLGWLNFGVHELGHIVFSPLGEWMGVAGGSFAQLLVPLYGMWQFLQQRDYFAFSFCFCWLGENLQYLSVYIADARKMELPPLTPFNTDVVIHDWNYLLDSVGLLASEKTIAKFTALSAFFSVTIFLWLGAWIVWNIFQRSAEV